MSLQLEFEPHSWYKGWAIKKKDDPTGAEGKWDAVTYDSIRGRWLYRQADTLKGLKLVITEQIEAQSERDKYNRRMLGEEV